MLHALLLALPAALPGAVEVRDLAPRLEDLRHEAGVPALAAAVYRGDGVVASGVVGERRAGSDDWAAPSDRFHIGSCGKSMTATLIAIRVEDGELDWETTLAEAFPELAAAMRPPYRRATLEQLLAHAAALPDPWEGRGWPELEPDPDTAGPEQRARMVAELLALEPIGQPGEVQQYSNHGYGILGALLERESGSTWDELMATEVFGPLGLKSARTGGPALPDDPGQPWGHVGPANEAEPVPPEDPRCRVPAVIRPAGDVSCSIEDFARWAGLHLRGLRGADTELASAQTVRRMHTPVFGNYAHGWRVERTSAGTVVHIHNGSNHAFFSTMAVFPEADLAVVAAANSGEGGAVVERAIWMLANEYAR